MSRMFKKWIGVSIFSLSATIASGANGDYGAEKQYSLTGEVTKVTAETVTVKQGVEEFQFTKKDLSADTTRNLKKGDKVTIFYTMDAKRVTSAQQAGETRPGEDAPGKQHILKDDRVFQTAGLNAEPSGLNTNHETQQPAPPSEE